MSGRSAPSLQVADRKRDVAMFNLAVDSKLRGCDVVASQKCFFIPTLEVAKQPTFAEQMEGLIHR
jgi:hypothetical protein